MKLTTNQIISVSLLVLVIILTICIRWQGIKISKLQEDQRNLVERQLIQNIHMLNETYNANLRHFQHKDSLLLLKLDTIQNNINKINTKKSETVKKIRHLEYQMDSLGDLDLPKPIR